MVALVALCMFVCNMVALVALCMFVCNMVALVALCMPFVCFVYALCMFVYVCVCFVYVLCMFAQTILQTPPKQNEQATSMQHEGASSATSIIYYSFLCCKIFSSSLSSSLSNLYYTICILQHLAQTENTKQSTKRNETEMRFGGRRQETGKE